MSYVINGQPLQYYGFYAAGIGKLNQAYALTGVWDLPKRTGKTHYDWRTEIEPYVDGDDIRFETRDFELSLVSDSPNLDAFNQNLQAFLIAIGDSFTLNEREVILQSMAVETYHNGWGQLTLKLQELTAMGVEELEQIPPGQDSCGIDGHSWRKLGFMVQNINDRHNVASWNPLNLTASGHTYGNRQAKNITVQGTIQAADYEDFKAKIKFLQSLIGRQGVREICATDGTRYRAFCVDGFTIDGIKRFDNNNHWADFQCKFITV